MQSEIFVQTELTVKGINPKLNGEVIFMASSDGGNEQGQAHEATAAAHTRMDSMRGEGAAVSSRMSPVNVPEEMLEGLKPGERADALRVFKLVQNESSSDSQVTGRAPAEESPDGPSRDEAEAEEQGVPTKKAIALLKELAGIPKEDIVEHEARIAALRAAGEKLKIDDLIDQMGGAYDEQSLQALQDRLSAMGYGVSSDLFARDMRRLLDLRESADRGELGIEARKRIEKAREGISESIAREARARVGFSGEFYSDMANVFLTNNDVREQLRSDTPNLQKLKDLNQFMNEYIRGSEATYGQFARLIANARETDDGKFMFRIPHVEGEGRNADLVFGDEDFIVISKRARELLFEWTIERIIGVPDKGSDEADYNIGSSIQLADNQDTVKQLLFAYFDRPFFERMTTLSEVRPIVHEMNRVVSKSEEYVKYLAGLDVHRLDFVRNRVAGVDYVIQALETASLMRLARTHKTFDNEDIRSILGDVEKIVRHKHDKETLVDDTGRQITEWEMVRALKFGRSYFSAMQKFGVYAYLGDLRPTNPERVGSDPFEYIKRKIQPLKANGPRWYGGGDGSRWFMDQAVGEMSDEEVGSDDARTRTLLGINKKVMHVNNDGSIYDIVDSHGWRSQLVYAGNIDISENGIVKTLLDYYIAAIEASQKQHGNLLPPGESFDPLYGFHPGAKADKPNVSGLMEEVVLGQRLYLSVVSRSFNEMDSSLRIKLWKKMATLSPLTALSLRPEQLTEHEWAMLYRGEEGQVTAQERQAHPKLTDEQIIAGRPPSIRMKIFLAQQARVAFDKGTYYFNSDGSVKPQDRAALAEEAGKYNELYAFEDSIRKMGLGVLSPDEKVFYRNCRRGMTENKGIFDIDAAGYQRWLSLDARVTAQGFQQLQNDAARFARYETLRQEYKYRLINYFDEKNGNSLSKEEKNLVLKIIDSGFVIGEELGITKLPYTIGVDDAPRIALHKRGRGFAGMETPDLIRQIGDQGTMGEGWNELNTFIEHPTHHYDEVWTKFVEPIGKVLGRPTAQGKIKPWIAAWVGGTIEKKKSKLFGSVMYDANMGRSKLEELYPGSNLAWTPQQRMDYLRGLGNQGVLSSHRHEKELKGNEPIVKKIIFTVRKKLGIPELDASTVMELQRKKKANRTHVVIDRIINFLMILFPELFVETTKGTKQSFEGAIQ